MCFSHFEQNKDSFQLQNYCTVIRLFISLAFILIRLRDSLHLLVSC